MASWTWNPPQSRFLTIEAEVGGPAEYVDYEGAVRAGKSTAPAHKLARYAVKYPGICMAACRWTQDSLDAQVKPLWRKVADERGLKLQWNPHEEYDEIVGYGSKVYLRALKASEETARFGKLAGLTLACLWIDQPEEVERDVVEAYLPARLSQPGYPHEAWFTPNPVGDDHWLSSWFPLDGSIQPHHHYIHTSVYDNRHVLGEAYISDLEAKYPKGSALRLRFVDGHRGLGVVGTAVYQGYFSRDWHVVTGLDYEPKAPLYEAWDFGWGHPAVLWTQYVRGQWRVLGEAMGAGALSDFSAWALQQRQSKWPGVLRVDSVCDPAGWAHDSQGHRDTAAEMLRSQGVMLAPYELTKAYNHPGTEYNAIQRTCELMRQTSGPGVPAFVVDASCRTFATGLEAGYIWSDKHYTGSLGSVKRVDKDRDTTYHHLQDCWLYTLMRWGSAGMTQAQMEKQQAKMARAEFERQSRDYEPTDRPSRYRRVGGRAGL